MATLDATRPLTTSRRLRRRKRVDLLARTGATVAALLAVAILALVVYTVIAQGAAAISIPFLTQNQAVGLGSAGGGIANAIIGSALIVAVATIIAVPVGVLIAIYLTEFARPAHAAWVRLALDLLNGTPSIVVGVFVFGLFVAGSGQTGLAGSLALAIIMLPLLARTTQEMFLLVPREQRDAAHALGVSRWRTIVSIVLPGSFGGILTGVSLAVARASGESAPLILVSSVFNASQTTLNVFGQPIPNIPVDIFTYAESPFAPDHPRAWGAALVLMTGVFVANISGRALHARWRRRFAG